MNVSMIGYIMFKTVSYNTLAEFVQMLTNWVVAITFMSSFLEFIITNNPSLTFTSYPRLHAFQHLLYSFTLFLNPIIIIVYWGFIHKQHMVDLERDYQENDLYKTYQTHSYLTHGFGPLSAAIQLYTFNETLVARHSIYFVYVIAFYMVINFIMVKKNGGKPIYWFLTWEDSSSLLICSMIGLFFYSLYYLMATVDQFVTQKQFPKN